jgi:hypothetical protein
MGKQIKKSLQKARNIVCSRIFFKWINVEKWGKNLRTSLERLEILCFFINAVLFPIIPFSINLLLKIPNIVTLIYFQIPYFLTCTKNKF